MNLAYLTLGSSLDPGRNLRAAVAGLERFGRILAASTVWETAPAGWSDRSPFLNAAILLETGLSASALREEAIAAIEADLGRVRPTDRGAPIPIDIDIRLFNRDCLTIGKRRIPDPEIRTHPFVAIPLAEIAPDYVHPETGETLQQIAARFVGAAGMRRREAVDGGQWTVHHSDVAGR
jgi:2-amino-4-hydroxy-6-hydroxymethyldihydropteridine diphosphokinase